MGNRPLAGRCTIIPFALISGWSGLARLFPSSTPVHLRLHLQPRRCRSLSPLPRHWDSFPLFLRSPFRRLSFLPASRPQLVLPIHCASPTSNPRWAPAAAVAALGIAASTDSRTTTSHLHRCTFPGLGWSVRPSILPLGVSLVSPFSLSCPPPTVRSILTYQYILARAPCSIPSQASSSSLIQTTYLLWGVTAAHLSRSSFKVPSPTPNIPSSLLQPSLAKTPSLFGLLTRLSLTCLPISTPDLIPIDLTDLFCLGVILPRICSHNTWT